MVALGRPWMSAPQTVLGRKTTREISMKFCLTINVFVIISISLTWVGSLFFQVNFTDKPVSEFSMLAQLSLWNKILNLSNWIHQSNELKMYHLLVNQSFPIWSSNPWSDFSSASIVEVQQLNHPFSDSEGTRRLFICTGCSLFMMHRVNEQKAPFSDRELLQLFWDFFWRKFWLEFAFYWCTFLNMV